MYLFNRYQYEPSTDRIGRGEFSEVFEALDTHIYLPVAVKIYRAAESLDNFGFVRVNKITGLDHPNICRYLHIGEIGLDDTDKHQVCVMELLRDGNFATYYQNHRHLDLLRKLVLDILHGLTYLHSQRIVHRRLKASNLLVGMTTQGPVVKITDFGIGSGKATSRDAPISEMVIDVPHMAPEQLNVKEYGINGSISYHIDFWALGLAVYEALTDNDILFQNGPGDNPEQVIRNILAPRVPLKVLRLPAPFDKFVMRCLTRHADHRPQNTRELIELLSRPIPATGGGAMGGGVTVSGVMGSAAAAVEAEPAKEVAAIAVEMADTAAGGAAGGVVGTGKASMKGRYEYEPNKSLIGKGGFARVYKAFDKKLSRWVALKFYKTTEFPEKYSPVAEIQRVINLDHPNICRYLDIEELENENIFGEKETLQVSVMELLDGGNLHEYCTAHPTEPVLRKLLTDVLHGLAYLHKNGIIHRDIKPANILIKETYEGPIAKITDFGVSKVSDAARTNRTSALVVSIPYMAPEQLNVKKYGINGKVSFNLDCWAFGVTVYEVITGKTLFKNTEEDSNEEIMANILSANIQDKLAALAQPYREIVQRCLVKDAGQRAQQPGELIELLNTPLGIPEEKVEAPVSEVAAEVDVKTGMRLIPGVKTETQDVFARGNNWLWAEAVSAPSMGEPTQPIIPRRGWVKRGPGLRIAIVAATVFIMILVYITGQTRKMTAALQTPSATPAAALPSIKPQDVSEAKITRASLKSADDGETGLEDEPDDKSGDKCTLLLYGPRTCSILINDIPYGVLQGGRLLKVHLAPGAYRIKATGTSGSPAIYTGRLVIPRDGPKTQVYRIQPRRKAAKEFSSYTTIMVQ